MFKPIENGTKVTICKLDCWIPPVPKDKYKIRGHNLPKSEQKWFRTEFPDLYGRDIEWVTGDSVRPNKKVTWQEARRQELAMQTGCDILNIDNAGNPKAIHGVTPDPDYVNDKMHDFRVQEFTRCNPYNTDLDGNPVENGLWFYNCGVPTYLTPFHYFYLNWWRLNTGYPYYRDVDRDKWYFWQTVFEDPMCRGMVEAANRGQGKTFRATSASYQVTIYGKNTESAIQSKTELDAKNNVFIKKMALPYKHLPDFFVPINSHGTDPKNGMRFELTGKRGKNSMTYRLDQTLALNSTIQYYSSGAYAADGDNITGVFILDESGKTTECDVSERHDVVKECVRRDGVVYGKLYITTTVEKGDQGGDNFFKIWDDSDPDDKTELGETISGVVKLFIPSYMSEIYDQFGRSVVDDPDPKLKLINQKTGKPIVRGAKTEQQIRRDALKDNPSAYLAYCLKYPWTEEELFYNSAENCPFNVLHLEDYEMRFKMGGYKGMDLSHGNLSWKDNKMFTEVIFTEDTEKNSKFQFHNAFLSDKFIKQYANRVGVENYGGKTYYMPLNKDKFSIGYDPTKSGAESEKRKRSSAAGSVFSHLQFFEPDYPMNTWVADYVHTPDDPMDQYKDMLMLAWYFGCPILLESNINNMFDNFAHWGCFDRQAPDKHFIIWRWEEIYTNTSGTQNQAGLASNQYTNQMLLENAVSYHNKHGNNMLMYRTNKALKAYRTDNRTKHDLGVASQLSCMAASRPVKKPEKESESIGKWFR